MEEDQSRITQWKILQIRDFEKSDSLKRSKKIKKSWMVMLKIKIEGVEKNHEMIKIRHSDKSILSRKLIKDEFACL